MLCFQNGDDRGDHRVVHMRHSNGYGHCVCEGCWSAMNVHWRNNNMITGDHVAGSLLADGRPCECIRCTPSQYGRPLCPMCRQSIVSLGRIDCSPVIIEGGGRKRKKSTSSSWLSAGSLREMRNSILRSEGAEARGKNIEARREFNRMLLARRHKKLSTRRVTSADPSTPTL